jgi:hypothetical protein
MIASEKLYTMSYKGITDPGTLHTHALKGLDFYNEDIKILKHRLSEVASKNSGPEACQGIEHFENQFEIQEHNIHHLKHRIKDHQHLMSTDALAHAGQINQGLMEKEKKLMDDFTLLEKVVNEIRHEFNLFLSKWM